MTEAIGEKPIHGHRFPLPADIRDRAAFAGVVIDCARIQRHPSGRDSFISARITFSNGIELFVAFSWYSRITEAAYPVWLDDAVLSVVRAGAGRGAPAFELRALRLAFGIEKIRGGQL